MATFELDMKAVISGAATIPVTYTLTISGLANFAAAHVHVGAAGVNGGVIHPLTPGVGTFNLASTNLKAFLSNGLYVNVHSAAFPGGEIRGQITGAPMAMTDGDGKAVTQFTPAHFGSVTLYGLAASNLSVHDSVIVEVVPLKLHLPIMGGK